MSVILSVWGVRRTNGVEGAGSVNKKAIRFKIFKIYFLFKKRLRSVGLSKKCFSGFLVQKLPKTKVGRAYII